MKRCGKCKQELPLENFGSNRSRADGKQSTCFTCRREVNREYYQRTPEKNPARRAYTDRLKQLNRDKLREILQASACVDCGNSDWRVLEFDHVRGEKLADVSAAISWSVDRLIAEVEKCDVRCANCHRLVTAQRAGSWRHSPH